MIAQLQGALGAFLAMDHLGPEHLAIERVQPFAVVGEGRYVVEPGQKHGASVERSGLGQRVRVTGRKSGAVPHMLFVSRSRTTAPGRPGAAGRRGSSRPWLFQKSVEISASARRR